MIIIAIDAMTIVMTILSTSILIGAGILIYRYAKKKK